jgi:hypothetical protein
VPFFRRRIVDSTFFEAARPYFAIRRSLLVSFSFRLCPWLGSLCSCV